MSNFPKLIPAFTAKIPITPPNVVGSTHTGGLNHVGFLTEEKYGGGIVSEPGYAIQIDSNFVHGSDFIRVDPDGKHVRLNVTSVLKNKADGALFSYAYTGVISMGGGAAKVFGGAADAKTTEYGEAFAHVKFETGAPTLKGLEDKFYVAAGRFVLEEGKPVVVEYKISEVSV